MADELDPLSVCVAPSGLVGVCTGALNGGVEVVAGEAGAGVTGRPVGATGWKVSLVCFLPVWWRFMDLCLTDGALAGEAS